MKTQASIDRVLVADFGMVDGNRTLDRAPGWFLLPEHLQYSYEWYLTGQGSPFRRRNGRCLRMSVPDRLCLALELLDLSEVWLWSELGWDAATINLAALKSGSIQLTADQLTAIATALSISSTWLRIGTGRMMEL